MFQKNNKFRSCGERTIPVIFFAMHGKKAHFYARVQLTCLPLIFSKRKTHKLMKKGLIIRNFFVIFKMVSMLNWRIIPSKNARQSNCGMKDVCKKSKAATV
ncbi:hypothetical protein B6D60_10065 [candidate division KSB1 bacterium 4484_87]|nr:MAG: hypothetical protein B6D60_10065 [candidate division KSB1 bacterium 4484_87]